MRDKGIAWLYKCYLKFSDIMHALIAEFIKELEQTTLRET